MGEELDLQLQKDQSETHILEKIAQFCCKHFVLVKLKILQTGIFSMMLLKYVE